MKIKVTKSLVLVLEYVWVFYFKYKVREIFMFVSYFQKITKYELQIQELREEVVQANQLRKQQLVELGLLREEEKQKMLREHENEVRGFNHRQSSVSKYYSKIIIMLSKASRTNQMSLSESIIREQAMWILELVPNTVVIKMQ